VKLIFSEHAWEDYLYWQKTDRQMLKRINRLIHEIMLDPFTGPGKPEPLKHGLSGYWSRRINDEHRTVYRPAEDAIFIAQLRYHY
jgi:toxin YoeB